MTAQPDGTTTGPISLSDEDTAFLIAILRDPNRSQPITTQQLIDALRNRAGR